MIVTAHLLRGERRYHIDCGKHRRAYVNQSSLVALAALMFEGLSKVDADRLLYEADRELIERAGVGR